MNLIQIPILLTIWLCSVHQAISGTVEAIKTNFEVPVNQTANLQWRVAIDAGERMSTANVFVLGSPNVQIIKLVSIPTAAGEAMFGNRLSASLEEGIYTLSIKKIKFNEKKHFDLRVIFDSPVLHSKNATVVIKDVIGGPLFCGANISKSYIVIEETALTLKQDVCGNPKPDVQWKMSSDSAYMPSESSVLKENITRTYQYTYTTKALTRANCGHIIEFRASGHKPYITEQTIININFTPAVATAIAYYHQDNCVHVNWKTEDTGNCKVTYQLTFNTGKNFEVTGNTFKNCSQEILRTTSVNIRGIYNGQRGDKSEDVFSSTRPPNPPKKDDGNNKGLIIGVVVSVIIIIIIIIVIVCVLKRRKNDESNYPLRYEEPEENDYVMDLNMPKTYAQPSSSEDRKNNPDQVIYSDVGMGGGRTGPKPVVAPAIYSEMKVDSRGYPVDGNNLSREKGVYSAVGPNSHSDSDSDADHYEGVVV
ncbi:uncharacterized protein LOC130635737 isoform X1 [Hydractinia symbiolongicarpus]|uniref:uncharacterized protein LOC130635737 isoform X1 n=1 Tax=Hydractinia symbiolongicarpus TaxID=13093 RepID=UPI002550347E|nr:uncharacterized protein LOC130635737 isoform X1 [Hydractinia symbiolongicarpus]